MDRQSWNRRYAGTELLWSARPNRRLVTEIAHVAPGRALDIACGEGRNAVWLAQGGWKVTGVDFSHVALAKARQLADNRDVSVDWVGADIRDYVPSREAFDLVMLLYLHVPPVERADALARATHALAPGGLLLVIGHDTSNPERGYGGPQDPAILFTPEDVANELPRLTIERAERFRRPVTTPQGEVHAIDALVRATKTARRKDAAD